ncbi:MAG TPA: antibiotic biosynthesis monooxygenase [Pyrinomonadaceae bacterium]|nr:antibiotic biosynthesis monooxygenase [Pyrinomonadaceae bacterium]
MNDEIAWRVEVSIKRDQVGNFLALTDEMVKSAMMEIGCLSYQRFIGADGDTVHIYERYLNSQVALAHLAVFFERFVDRYTSMVERRSFTVYGTPGNELRQLLDQFKARYFRPFGNLEYWA